MRHGFKTLLVFFTFFTLIGCSRLPVTSKKGKLYTIAFYNTETLYDTQDAPATPDEAFTPEGEMQWTQERYQQKLKNVASVIAGIGGKNGPAIIGLGEIENRQVLDDLLNTSPLSKIGYKVIHRESSSPDGLDLAFLYKPNVFKPTSTEYLNSGLKDKAAAQEILQVKGELRGELVTIYVNHWPAPTRTRRRRQDDSRLRAAATALRQEIDKQQKADPNTRIIVMGDFNAEPDAEVLEKALQATGRPDPAYNEELFNTHYLSFVSGHGSSLREGSLQMLDQIMVSKSLVDEKGPLEYVRG